MRGLFVLVIGTRRQRQLWTTVIANEYHCGMTTFAGAQMRYLVDAGHGWLAAIAFSVAALRLAARQESIERL